MPRCCHRCARPEVRWGIVTRLDCLPLGIVVNGAANASMTRARGRLAEALRHLGKAGGASAEPDGLCLGWTRKSWADSMPSVFPAIAADSIAQLAPLLNLPPGALDATVRASTTPCVPVHSITVLDDCRTEGLTPPKSPGRSASTAAVLRLPAAAGNYLYLSRSESGRPCARRMTWRCLLRQTSVPRERSWQGHPAEGLPGRGRNDHWNSVRADCR